MTREQPKAIDYELTDAQATVLAGCALLPVDLRRELLARFASEHGKGALVEAFAQFIGLANSVVANAREMVELILITEGSFHPHTAEQVNSPDIFGALNGAKLANRVSQDNPAMCSGCAFRRGTVANQCPSTVFDAKWTLDPGEPLFMCHDHEPHEEPSRACAGYALAKKAPGFFKLQAVSDDEPDR